MPSCLWLTLWRWTVGRSWRSTMCLKSSWSSWKQETGKRHFLQSCPSGKELFLHTKPVKALLRTISPGQKDGTVPARENIVGMTLTHHRKKSRASRASRAAQCPQWVLSHSDQPSLAVLHFRRTQRGWYHQIFRLQENPFSLITVVEFEILSIVNDNENSLNTKKGLFGFLWEDLKVSFQSCFKPQIRVMENVTIVLGLYSPSFTGASSSERAFWPSALFIYVPISDCLILLEQISCTFCVSTTMLNSEGCPSVCNFCVQYSSF